MSEETFKIEEIIPIIEKVKNTIVTMENELEKKQQEVADKEKLLVEREARLNEAQIQQQQLELKYASLETEFKKVSELFSEISEKEEASLDVKQLLSIYIALLEKVFEGKPHAKILYLLHGDKSEMTRQELTKATGFSPAIVLHSLHELNRAELINYNEELAKASLVNRIY
ncbi:MAG: ArsR family transcriptional regulator [Promethearchaeota archaeon]